MSLFERPAAAPSDVWSLLEHGRDAGLTTLGSALALDLDLPVAGEEAESTRAREHLQTLRAEFVVAETKQRMLQALVKGRDDIDGEGASLLGLIAEMQPGGAGTAKHEAVMQRLLEQQKQAAASLAEVQSHTTELATAIKEDIKKLLQGWSSLENSKSSLDVARQTPAAMRALAGWSLLQNACGAVETTLLAAKDLAMYEQGALSSEDGRMAHAVLKEAIKDATAALDELVATSAAGGAENQQQPSDAARQAAANFDLSSLEESGELLRKQGLLLSEWSSRNESLSAQVAAASRAAPQIASFSEGLRQANNSGVLNTPELDALRNKLKAARVATSVLSKVSGLTLLRSENAEEVQDATTGRIHPASRVTVALASQGITHANGAHSDEEMYGSEEAFGRMIATQEASIAAANSGSNETDVLILSILLHTSAQAAEVARAQGKAQALSIVASSAASSTHAEELAGSVLLSAQLLGVVSSASLAQFTRDLSASTAGNSSRASAAAASAVTRLLEEELSPPGKGVAACVERSVQAALMSQKQNQKGNGGVETLLRDVVFDIAAAR